jgi:uncharacterized protein YcbX
MFRFFRYNSNLKPMIVKSIIIYPIKGMKGTEVKSAVNLERGFENDRRYMLIDKNNTFISQRSHPILALVHPEIITGQIRISYCDVSFSFPLTQTKEEIVEATLFDNIVNGTLVSKALDEQFSKILNDDVRLIKMNENNVRNKKLIKGPASAEVSFADGYPYLIAGSASLDQLNEKLDNPVLMDRFRPNIVVETLVPHEEDNWESIQIGSAKMMVIKPCARCPVVTINQQTAEKSKDTLKTLSTYRKKENKVFFGANAISLGNSQISVGDEVVAL